MIRIRPIEMKDLDDLVALSEQAQVGLTTLPRDRGLLRSKIKAAQRSFLDKPDRPGGEIYLFVAEDMSHGRVVGTTALYAKVGGFQPFYTYKIRSEKRFSRTLNVRNTIRFLELQKQHDGPSEVGTLFLAPEYRGQGWGALLSLSRFLFVADHPACFEKEVIAEMRGVIDPQGRSPFWEALGKHFFRVDFKNADMMTLRDKSFIADMMPEFPVYTCLLPPRAQEVIGQVHERTRPALRLLQREGFVFEDEIDIFEAGPLIKARRDNIRSVRQSRVCRVRSIEAEIQRPQAALVSCHKTFGDFFAVTTGVRLRGGEVTLDRSTAESLECDKGAVVRVLRLSGNHNRGR